MIFQVTIPGHLCPSPATDTGISHLDPSGWPAEIYSNLIICY